MSASRKSRKPKQPPPLSERLRGYIVLSVVATIIGLAIANFVVFHAISRELIAALVFIAFAFGGYGADRLREWL